MNMKRIGLAIVITAGLFQCMSLSSSAQAYDEHDALEWETIAVNAMNNLNGAMYQPVSMLWQGELGSFGEPASDVFVGLLEDADLITNSGERAQFDAYMSAIDFLFDTIDAHLLIASNTYYAPAYGYYEDGVDWMFWWFWNDAVANFQACKTSADSGVTYLTVTHDVEGMAESIIELIYDAYDILLPYL